MTSYAEALADYEPTAEDESGGELQLSVTQGDALVITDRTRDDG